MPAAPDIVSIFRDAYTAGAFPMAEEPAHGGGKGKAQGGGGAAGARPWPIYWYRPEVRAVFDLTPDGLHVSRSLRRTLRRRPFRITTDAAFERTIRACARRAPGRGLPWLSKELIGCYVTLHRHGLAHSVEAWLDPAAPTPASGGSRGGEPALVGGVYGVHIGAAFFAESMFCRPDLGGTDASKVCLVHLFDHLRRRGFLLLDSQIANPHTERLGVREIPLARYLEGLRVATESSAAWTPFEPESVLRTYALGEP